MLQLLQGVETFIIARTLNMYNHIERNSSHTHYLHIIQKAVGYGNSVYWNFYYHSILRFILKHIVKVANYIKR